MAQELSEKIRAAAQSKGIDPELALSIARAESALNPAAKAKTSSAAGLFQVVDDTWKQYGGRPGKKLDADENIRVGTDIIADNAKYLQTVLGRAPKPAEVYAAHYFGPAKAKAVLAASPDTPIADILSAKAIKANPNLQGKTAGQVIAQLEGKVGGAPAPAAAVPRETKTEAEKVMEPALRSGMTAKAQPQAPVPRETQLASLGPSYQAALALSFLADSDDDKREKDIDSEPSVAEKWLAQQPSRPAALDLAEVKIRSPFPTEQPQPPVMMAEGGEAQTPMQLAAGSSPVVMMAGGGDPVEEQELAPAREPVSFFRNANRMQDMGADVQGAMAGARVPLGEDSGLTLGANISKMTKNEKETMARAMLASLYSKVGEGELRANLIKPQGPGTEGVYMGDVGGSYPVGEGRLSASRTYMHTPYGSGPTGYQVGYGGKVGPGFLSANAMLPDRGSPQFQIRYQLPVGRAEGSPETGEVKEPNILSVPTYSRTVSYEMYPGQEGQFDQRDAARHMLAAGTVARKYGPTAAEMLGKLHEITTSPGDWVMSKLGMGQMPVDYEQDLHNNRLGIELARRSKSQKELEDLVQQMAEKAQGQQTPGAAWIGKPVRPVKRAKGSPEGGESAEPTPEELEAASKPAFLTPKSGIGRKISTKPGELEAAALQGVSETPYNVVGAPVDLVTAAMRPFGYSVQAPVGGSEWLKQQASRAGVRQEPPSGAAARALYELGQLGGSAINPAAPVRRAAQAAEAVQESGKAAQMLEGMKNIPVGASVKPVEPFFQHTPSAEAPFVGRLDEFVAGLQNPVRKDQFLGQLKGKFRDYDIARAESVLKDLSADAKLTPSDLLNRLKTRYDPANIRTTVHEPRDTGFWRDQDNPYQDQPVGVIHISTHVGPEQAQRMAQLDKLDSQLFRAGDVSYTSTARIPELDFLRTNPIANTQVANLERSRQDLINHSAPLFEAKRLMNEYMYPATTPMYMGSMKDRAFWDEAMATAKRNGVPENQQVTYANELVMDSIRQPAMQKMQQMLGTVPRNESQLVDAVRAKQGQLWDDQRKSLAQDIAGMAQDMRRYFVNNAEKYGLEKPYKGRDIHYGLEPPVNAAGFTRFVPQTVQDPDRGPLKGIHLLEIQSDLTSELKAGTKPKLADKQVFPNMPENRRVVQQLGMKNAIAAAINRGDQFVTFPGSESAKPQLYESVRDNLKAVVKDLGPGFEIRPFTFTSPNKGEIQHWGITWDPKAAARIQEKGVPFKDGGAVERNTADHRKYL